MSYALGLGRGRPSPAGHHRALRLRADRRGGWELDLRAPGPAGGDRSRHPGSGDRASVGTRGARQLEAAGLDVTYRESPMGHSIDARFVAELRAGCAMWSRPRPARLEPAALRSRHIACQAHGPVSTARSCRASSAVSTSEIGTPNPPPPCLAAAKIIATTSPCSSMTGPPESPCSTRPRRGTTVRRRQPPAVGVGRDDLAGLAGGSRGTPSAARRSGSRGGRRGRRTAAPPRGAARAGAGLGPGGARRPFSAS